MFSSIVLTKESHNELLDIFDIPKGWKVYAHHSTIQFDGVPDEIKDKIGQKVEMTATHFGMLKNVMAVRVYSEIKSKNKVPHITIAVDENNGGKPVMSNNIIEWIEIPEIKLEGIVETE